MNELIQKNLIGAAMVYTLNHGLTYLTLNLGLKIAENSNSLLEGTIFGMLYNLPAYLVFITINMLTFSLLRKKFERWPLWLNVLLLLLLAHLFTGRFNQWDSFYWLRYIISFSSLFLVNFIVYRLSWKIKVVIGIIPLIMVCLTVIAYS